MWKIILGAANTLHIKTFKGAVYLVEKNTEKGTKVSF